MFREMFKEDKKIAVNPGSTAKKIPDWGKPPQSRADMDITHYYLRDPLVEAGTIRMALAQLQHSGLDRPHAGIWLNAIADNWGALRHISDSPHDLRRKVALVLLEADKLMTAGADPAARFSIEESRHALVRILRKAPVEYGC